MLVEYCLFLSRFVLNVKCRILEVWFVFKMYVILIEDFLFFMILFGLVKYIYLNIYVVGGLLFGRGAM